MPLPSTYTPIATNTLSSNTASVTFSNIPQTYTDLVLIVSGAMSGSGNTVYARLNGDSGSNYSQTYLGGTGSASYSGRSSNNTQGLGLGGFYTGYSTGQYTLTAHFQNYSNTTTYKTVLTRWADASSNGSAETIVNLWRNTSAITSIEVRNSSGGTQNFNSGSTFTLYGIKAAS